MSYQKACCEMIRLQLSQQTNNFIMIPDHQQLYDVSLATKQKAICYTGSNLPDTRLERLQADSEWVLALGVEEFELAKGSCHTLPP